jgi:GntR family carbon starvation induced transcriptional regulator
MKKTRKLTKTTQIMEKLLQDITNGAFAPGDKLQMETLKQHYGVGGTPLREALSRLVSRGLVQFEEQCGFHVSSLSLAELQDLYEVRLNIENIALEWAIEKGDADWEADIIVNLHRLTKYIDPKLNRNLKMAEWDKLQKDFYLALVKGCQSPWLLKIRDMLHDQALRYRAICFNNSITNVKTLTAIIDDNKKLAKAVLSRDKEKAIKIANKTWKDSVKIISEFLKNPSKA